MVVAFALQAQWTDNPAQNSIIAATDTTGNSFKVFAFHYDANGSSTISDPHGAIVHSENSYLNYKLPDVSIDPVTNDLLITFVQTTSFSYFPKLYVNRITATGERVWDDGVLVFDAVDQLKNISRPGISAFEDGSGFAVSYFFNDSGNDDGRYTVEASGYEMSCNVLWNKQLCSNRLNKTTPRTITGFHNGQNIIAWGNLFKNIIYAQNFGIDGTMGQGVVGIEEIFGDEEEIVVAK